MKFPSYRPSKTILPAILCFLTFHSFAQEGWENRITDGYDPLIQPFYHGVASGEPTQNSLNIWTRVTPETNASVPVAWYISTTPDLADFAANIVAQGNTSTDATQDYTVKIAVNGLQENTWYYYIFHALGKYSVMGRTKTAPANPDHLRFGVVSCSNYAHGYFNAYRGLTDRNDVDAVFHLGDYIYEYADGEFGSFRDLAPPYEMVSLDNYRSRYSYYRLDPDLRDLHQQYPFITVWDDHETTNNSHQNGAANHNPDNDYKATYDPTATEGDWNLRKGNAKQAYLEWLPVTIVDPIYRKFSYGNLADIYFLDTRLEGREEQMGATSFADQQSNSPNRTILGQTQYNWMTNDLAASSATWKILAQQVMMTELTLGGSTPINMDSWDGYAPERSRFYDHLTNNNIDNLVVLTGDIHTSWASELPHTDYDDNDPCNTSKGVEYVVTSVTSTGLIDFGGLGDFFIKLFNPHIKYINLADHGFIIYDVTPTKTQADWFYVSTLTDRNFTIGSANSYYNNLGESCVLETNTESPADAYPDLVPTTPPTDIPGLDPLPLELLSFTGTKMGNRNRLDWNTEAEVNTSHFTIERSQSESQDFRSIGEELAKGNSSNTYAFIDNNPLLSTNYYRLKMVDRDGSFAYSPLVAIKGKDAFDGRIFSPNPAVDFTSLSFHATISEGATIHVMDGHGKVHRKYEVQITEGYNDIRIDLEGLAAGVYLLGITHESGVMANGTVIKMK